jgi:hypothetical protein
MEIFSSHLPVENGVKRDVKRGETKPISRETRASVFERLRFMFFAGLFIGKRLLKWPFVSRFTSIGMKCEMNAGFVK